MFLYCLNDVSVKDISVDDTVQIGNFRLIMWSVVYGLLAASLVHLMYVSTKQYRAQISSILRLLTILMIIILIIMLVSIVQYVIIAQPVAENGIENLNMYKQNYISYVDNMVERMRNDHVTNDLFVDVQPVFTQVNQLISEDNNSDNINIQFILDTIQQKSNLTSNALKSILQTAHESVDTIRRQLNNNTYNLWNNYNKLQTQFKLIQDINIGIKEIYLQLDTVHNGEFVVNDIKYNQFNNIYNLKSGIQKSLLYYDNRRPILSQLENDMVMLGNYLVIEDNDTDIGVFNHHILEPRDNPGMYTQDYKEAIQQDQYYNNTHITVYRNGKFYYNTNVIENNNPDDVQEYTISRTNSKVLFANDDFEILCSKDSIRKFLHIKGSNPKLFAMESGLRYEYPNKLINYKLQESYVYMMNDEFNRQDIQITQLSKYKIDKIHTQPFQISTTNYNIYFFNVEVPLDNSNTYHFDTIFNNNHLIIPFVPKGSCGVFICHNISTNHIVCIVNSHTSNIKFTMYKIPDLSLLEEIDDYQLYEARINMSPTPIRTREIEMFAGNSNIQQPPLPSPHENMNLDTDTMVQSIMNTVHQQPFLPTIQLPNKIQKYTIDMVYSRNF